MPYKYMRVCPVCQRSHAVNLISHLAMVYGLIATERANYLKRAILCPPTSSSGTATEYNNGKGQTKGYRAKAGSTSG